MAMAASGPDGGGAALTRSRSSPASGDAREQPCFRTGARRAQSLSGKRLARPSLGLSPQIRPPSEHNRSVQRHRRRSLR